MGSKSTAIGSLALNQQNFTTATDTFNTAVGFQAGTAVTTGVQNTLVGGLAGDAMTVGQNNVAIGVTALSSDVGGSRTVAIGRGALENQNMGSSDTNSHNTAVGYGAGATVTTGIDNTFIGALAGDGTNDGTENVAVGKSALSGNCGDDNVAVGKDCLEVTTGSNNTAVGMSAGKQVSSGDSNVFIGKDAGDSTTSGSKNICIGQNANSQSASTDNTIAIGHDIAISANHFGFGKASNIVFNVFTTEASWARSSDERLKKNVQNTDLGLDFINDLRTVKYNWKANHELDSSDSQLAHLYKEDPADNDMDTESTMHGFIAQEVKAALDTAGVSDWGGWLEDQHGVQQVSREMFVIPLVKAVQELSAQVTALTARVAELEGE